MYKEHMNYKIPNPVHYKNQFAALMLFRAKSTHAGNCLPVLNTLTNFMQQDLFLSR
jgi:hypothetical protein